MDKYDQIVDWIGSHWVGAIVLLLLAILAALPSTRDGALLIWSWMNGIVARLRRTTITLAGEKAVLTVLLRDDDWDIVKIDADGHVVGVGSEYQWLNRMYRGCEVKSQALTTLDLIQGKAYDSSQIHFDVVSITLKNGKSKNVYFDISSFFNGASGPPLSPRSKVARKIAKLYKVEIAEQNHAGDARNARA